MNTHAQALGRLGGLANRGKPKSEAHKMALAKVLEASRKRTTLPQDAREPENHTPIPKPEPKARTCQSPHCNNQGKEVLVQGLKAWLCEVHG